MASRAALCPDFMRKERETQITELTESAVAMLKSGALIRETAQHCGVGYGVLWRHVQQLPLDVREKIEAARRKRPSCKICADKGLSEIVRAELLAGNGLRGAATRVGLSTTPINKHLRNCIQSNSPATYEQIRAASKATASRKIIEAANLRYGDRRRLKAAQKEKASQAEKPKVVAKVKQPQQPTQAKEKGPSPEVIERRAAKREAHGLIGLLKSGYSVTHARKDICISLGEQTQLRKILHAEQVQMLVAFRERVLTQFDKLVKAKWPEIEAARQKSQARLAARRLRVAARTKIYRRRVRDKKKRLRQASA